MRTFHLCVTIQTLSKKETRLKHKWNESSVDIYAFTCCNVFRCVLMAQRMQLMNRAHFTHFGYKRLTFYVVKCRHCYTLLYPENNAVFCSFLKIISLVDQLLNLRTIFLRSLYMDF